MHELAVCQALLDQVQAIADDHPGATVVGVTVSVGPLSGVLPELLERAYQLARATGPAAGAALQIETLPVRVRCRSCGAETETAPSRLLCGRCGDFRTVLVAGDELVLRRVELASREPRAAVENEVIHV